MTVVVIVDDFFALSVYVGVTVIVTPVGNVVILGVCVTMVVEEMERV